MTAGEGGGGQGGSGGQGGGDVLGLAQCEGEPLTWDKFTELPAQSWAGGDEHAAMCALRAVDSVAAGKRIFCSAENNHGVAESSRWHALVARYLVHRFGFRTIAFEASAATVAGWDRFLDSGDPADLALPFEDAPGSSLDVVEQEHLVNALRGVQGELPAGQRLRLTGFDVAVQPHLTRAALLAYLGVVAADEVATWEMLLPDLAQGVDWQAAGQSAGDLYEELEANQAAYIASSDEARWRAARRDLANLRDGYFFLDYYFDGNFPVGDATFREPGMIRNVDELVSEADAPVLMIAHDLHCVRDYAIGNDAQGQPSPAVGSHLADTLGGEYFVLGQLYYSGTFLMRTATGFTELPVSVDPSSLEAALSTATAASGIIVGTTTTVVPMNQSWPMWNQGPFVPRAQYDGLLWLRDVTATTLR